MKKLLLSILSISALSAQAQVLPLGSAANMLTLLNANTHSLSVSDACSTVVFIHRSDPSLFASENPAHYRYDISTDNGASFLINKGTPTGPLNPQGNNSTISSRYPQAIIDNPTNATNPANLYMQYLGTYHNGGDWDGVTVGAAKLDQSAATSAEVSINSGDVGVITSMCKGDANTFWGITESLDASNVNLGDIVILKGTKVGNTVTWTTNKILTPSWDQHSGEVKSGALNISFDPSGQKGWVAFLGDLRSEVDPNINEVYDLNFYKTTNGGTTWEGPYVVNLNDFTLIQTVYPVPAGTTNIIDAVTAGFESDLAVDANGQPHMFFGMGYGSSESEIAAGNGYSIRASNMFDLTYDNNINRFVLNFIADIKQMRADSIGTTLDANNNVVANSSDMRPQVSTSPDGSLVFFTWSDNITQNIGGVDTVIDNNTARYLYLRAFDPTNGVVSPMRVVSTETAYSAVNDKAYFFSAAPVVQRKTTSSVIPVVYGVLNADKSINSTSTFNYMQNIEVLDDSIVYLNQKDTLGFDVLPTWPVGVSNTVANAGLEIYPNPATTHFCVANVLGNKNTIRVYNLSGSIVYSTSFSSTILKTISTKDLAAGTYIVELESDGKISKTKLTKN